MRKYFMGLMSIGEIVILNWMYESDSKNLPLKRTGEEISPVTREIDYILTSV